jgi:hypothetical protein
MTQTTAASTSASTWEREIRDLEEEARVAFLQADTDTLTHLWADGFTVTSARSSTSAATTMWWS